MKPSNPSRFHLIGVDLVRLVLIVPMAMMHAWNIFFGEPTITVKADESFYPFYHKVSEMFLGYAGIFIFLISFFLFGFLQKTHFFQGKRGVFRFLILAGAMLSTQFQWGLKIGDAGFFNWDLFSFILLSFAVLSFLARLSNKTWRWIGIFSGLFLCTPPLVLAWIFGGRLLPTAENILIASTSSLGPNGWFLLPWLALPLLSFAWGRFCRSTDTVNGAVSKILAVVSIIAIASGFLVAREPLLMGSSYYNFLFREHPLVLLQNLIPFLAILFWLSRPSVNERLERWGFGFVAHLQWNKNFWLAYAMHFGVLDLFTETAYFSENLRHFDMAWLLALVGVEVLLQMFFAALKVYALIFRKVFRRPQKVT